MFCLFFKKQKYVLGALLKEELSSSFCGERVVPLDSVYVVKLYFYAYKNFEYFSIDQQIKVSLIWTSREIADLPKYFYIEKYLYKNMFGFIVL